MLFVPQHRELAFDHAGDRLVGDLFLPPAASAQARVPALVMVAGSGPGSRQWEHFGERFTAAGLAAFAYDKPGVGDSTGDWTRQSLHDRAAEALAAVAAIGAQPEVDAGRIALVGGSQGGWVAPLAAAASDTVSAICVFSGPGVSVAVCEEYQILHEGPQEGYTPAEVDAALALFRRVLDRLRRGDDPAEVYASEASTVDKRVAELAEITDAKELAFFGRIADYDPVPALEAVRCPVLAIFGADDVLIPVEASVAAFEGAFARSGHDRHRIVVFPGADHRVRTPDPETGTMRRAPGFFELIAAWLARTLQA